MFLYKLSNKTHLRLVNNVKQNERNALCKVFISSMSCINVAESSMKDAVLFIYIVRYRCNVLFLFKCHCKFILFTIRSEKLKKENILLWLNRFQLYLDFFN